MLGKLRPHPSLDIIDHHNHKKIIHYGLCSFSNLSVPSSTSQLIPQPFRRFTYVTAHSSNLSVASPTSQLILQPFFRFSYVTGSSLMSPGEPPMFYILRGTYKSYFYSSLYTAAGGNDENRILKVSPKVQI